MPPQELKGIVDRIAELRSHAASIDWGDGTPPPSVTVTIDWDDAKAATDYVDQVNAVQGWMATSNVPEDLYMHRKLPGKMKSGQLSGKTKSGNK
jgi:hypothetical protein